MKKVRIKRVVRHIFILIPQMIIIIAGPSGVGKTTLAKKLAKRFQLPVIHKDDIKEILFDTLGSESLERAKELGKASWEIFYHFAEEQISNDVSLILESNFKARFAEEVFIKFKKKYDVNIIQIMCKANINTIVERFKKRAVEDRHPGHNDHLISETNLRKGIEEESIPLNINAPLIEMDMNDFGSVDYEALFAKIEELK